MTSPGIYQGDTSVVRRNEISKVPPNVWSLIKHALFITGSVLVVLAALRNTITYQLQRFWGASGDFWQNQWDLILTKFGDDPFNLFVYGTFLVALIVYWGVGSIYTYMDLTGKPKFLRRYKIQPGTNEPVHKQDLTKLAAVVLFNQFLSIPVAVVGYYICTLRGLDTSRNLPTFQWVLLELAVFIFMEEVGFYYSHRMFHHRLFYKRFHKLHHNWQSPISLTAIYCHPLEHVLSNLMPIFLGPLIMGSHIATICLWVALVVLSTLNAHSGYHLPFFPSPEAHDFHHLQFNQCYGVLGLLDHLHGTDDKFRLTPQFSRHIMMLSFIPPREAIPSVPEGKKLQEGKKNI